MKKMKTIKRGAILILTTLFLSAAFACNYAPLEEKKSAATPATVEDKQAQFESDVQTMRTANFEFIFVFRRKDGAAFVGEDKKYLKSNLPFNNRVILSDEEKAVVVGSNYKFPPENLEVLRARFNVEDYSAAKQEAK